jgi:branched-chain amino acid transport system permease protein
MGDYLLYVVNSIAITLVAVLGLNILTGYCGQVNLGQAAFMAVGAYTSTIVIERLGVSFWLSIPLAAVGTGIVGILFGLPALRVKGFYLAITTLAAQFIITWVILHGGDITHTSIGVLVPHPTLGGIVFNNERKWFYVIIPITLLMGLFAKNIVRTRVGRAFIAIRDNDLAAEVMGINLFYYKMLAFFICSVYAGIAGSLWANYITGAHYEHYLLMDSVWMLGMLIVGGLGSIMGAVFGTVFVKLLVEGITYAVPIITEFIRLSGLTVASLGLVTTGFVIILFLIFEPRGINHRWEVFKNTYRIFPFSY